MKTAARAGLIFLSLAAAPGVAAGAKPPPRAPIDFEADHLEYAEENKVIVASGSVKITQTSYTFTSDRATFDLPNNNVTGEGRIRMHDLKGNEVRARLLTYNLDTGSAMMEDAEGTFGPFLFAAKKVRRKGDGSLALTRARLTTCEEDLSKYHLYGYRINAVPEKHMSVWHALFKVGPVPVFYLPYYYYPLSDKHLAFQFFPGQNQSEGTFVRTVWGYPITDETYMKVYLDYMSRRGYATGGEFNYYVGNRLKGSLYGLTVDDRLTDRRRWNGRLYHWQSFSPELTLQSNVNRMSDDFFPNDFVREDFDRVVRQLNAEAALTYQKKSHLLRLLAQRTDIYDLNTGEYYSGIQQAPRLDYSHFQTTVSWGFEHTYGAFIANRFMGLDPLPGASSIAREYRTESDAFYTLIRSFRLTRDTIFLPRVTVRNGWFDRLTESDVPYNHVQRLQTDSTLRQRFGFIADVDLTYQLSQRLQDNNGVDGGRETHRLNFLNTIRPNEKVDFRFETAHILPRVEGDKLALLDRSRYEPLTGEFSYTSDRNWEFFARERYMLFDPLTGKPHPESTQGEFVFGRRAFGEDYYMIGTSYFYSNLADNYEIRQSARKAFFKWLSLELTVRTLMTYRNSNALSVVSGNFTEKEARVRSSWRCWDIVLLFRERKGVFEFLFNVELQLDRDARQKSGAKEHAEEWYPWRNN